MPRSTDKNVLLIDGANLHATAKALGFEIDYRLLLHEFQRSGPLLRAIYYTLIWETEEYSGLRLLIDWLEYNGYSIVSKPANAPVDANGRRRAGNNINVELAVDAMTLASHVDRIALFSGNGDFCPLVEAVQRRGVHVTVISTIASKPPMIADELRRQADAFIDLAKLKSKITRDPRDGSPPREEHGSP